MKTAISVTHVLLMFIIGGIIGCIISGNVQATITLLILGVLDIILGLTLQYLMENPRSGKLSAHDKAILTLAMLEVAMQKMKNEEEEKKKERLATFLSSNSKIDEKEDFDDEDFDESDCDKFEKTPVKKETNSNSAKEESEEEDEDDEPDALHNKIYYKLFQDHYNLLRSTGGARLLKGPKDSISGAIFTNLCMTMQHAPPYFTLLGLRLVTCESIGGIPTLSYSFSFRQNSICENARIFLVLTKEGVIRFFALETNYSTFHLCEYSGFSHINYGEATFSNVKDKINKIINNEESAMF